MEFIQLPKTFHQLRRGKLSAPIMGCILLLAGWISQESGMLPRAQAAQAAEPVASLPPPGEQGAHPVILLADAEYLPRMLDMFAHAQHSIDITMFSCVLPDNARADHPVRRLLEALVARKKAGVAVRIVLDHGVPPSRRQPDEEVPSEAAARWLAGRSIAVRWDEDERTTHTKSLVIDGRWCVVGSTNWTFSALRRNREQSLLLDDRVLAATLTTQFTALWERATPVPSPAQR